MHNFAKYYVTIALLLVVAQAHSSVVLIFGWSGTNVAAVDEGLKNQGIESTDFERSNSMDKGLGIAIVTRDKAEAYKNNCKKCFANIHSVLPGISEIGDLQVSFEEGRGEIIKFGKSEDAYSGIFTDDPSMIVSGRPQGLATRGDALWSTEKGNTAVIKMYSTGGRQYVKMNAVVKGGTGYGTPPKDEPPKEEPAENPGKHDGNHDNMMRNYRKHDDEEPGKHDGNYDEKKQRMRKNRKQDGNHDEKKQRMRKNRILDKKKPSKIVTVTSFDAIETINISGEEISVKASLISLLAIALLW